MARQAPLSMEFFRQEHWIGKPLPTPDLPDPEIKFVFHAYPALAGVFFTTVSPGKPQGGSGNYYQTTAECHKKNKN